MKKITWMLCLLFAVSIRMICAQTLQSPAAIIDKANGSDYNLAVNSMLPDATPAEISGTPYQADKLNMISSPNPFTNQTLITCCLPAKGKLTLEIRNMFGETVRSIEDNVEQEGNHSIEVTSDQLRPGIYSAMLIFKTRDNTIMETIRIVYSQ
jgi:hypothetical protein